MNGRLTLWLFRHPMVAVLLGLAVLAGAGLGTASVLAPQHPASSSPRPLASFGTARSTLPAPTSRPPQARVVRVHGALHTVGRICKQSAFRPDSAPLRRAVTQIERFATDFPDGGFDIDGESASTLALLVVVRAEMRACAPSLIARLERLLPVGYRDPT